MITEVFPIEINGVKYRIDESMEQAGYSLHRQPLRAPVNGFIQGESGRFQMRPDILEWSMSDWSAGEGYLNFSDEVPNGYLVGYNIDPLTESGTLRLSALMEAISTTGTGSQLSTYSASLVTALDALYLVDFEFATSDARIRKYDAANGNWMVPVSDSTGTTDESGIRGAWGDATHLFFGGRTTDTVRWDGTTFVVYPSASVVYVLGSVGGFLYGLTHVTSGANIHEFSVAGTPPVSTTVVKTLAEIKQVLSPSNPARFAAIAGSNALYLLAYTGLEETVLWRITPTTAAGTGFVNEMLRIPGFRGLVPMYNLGVLYIAGLQGEVPVIFTWDEATEEFGVLYRNPARPTNHPSNPSATVQEMGGGIGSEFARSHFIMIGGPTANDGTTWQVMTVDSANNAVVGGTVITPAGNFNDTSELIGRHDVIVFNGRVIVCLVNPDDSAAGASETFQTVPGFYTEETGIMESVINDFKVAEKKILLAIHLDTDPLPANTSVTIKYQLDQNGTWVSAGTHDVDGATEKVFTISTGADTESFNNLQLRVELDTTSPSTSPIVRRVAVRATVVRGVRVWDLLLDASDEDGQMQDRSWNGATLMTNIATAGDTGAVVTFKDGYRDRTPNSFTTHNVVVDEYRILGDRPGEGHVMVRLRETT